MNNLNRINLILFSLIVVSFCSIYDAKAAFQCSLNGMSYPDAATCGSNCTQTASCSTTGSVCSIGYWWGDSCLTSTNPGGTINIHYTESEGYTGDGTWDIYHTLTFNGACVIVGNDYAIYGKWLAVSGSMAGTTYFPGTSWPVYPGQMTVTATLSQIYNTSSVSYSCPIYGGSACSGNPQVCYKTGTCTQTCVPNNCEDSTCPGTQCWNGCAWVEGIKDKPYSCIINNPVCKTGDCGKTLRGTALCINSCGKVNPLECSNCVSSSVTCPPCDNNWKEVAP